MASSFHRIQQFGDLSRGGELALECRRQSLDQPVRGDAYGLLRVPQRILHDGPPLLLAENDADGWIFLRQADALVQGSQIELHLAHELRLKLSDFQLNRYQAPQWSM